MAPTVTEIPASITREQLRTFHIAGHGLEHAIPAGPLRTTALELLNPLSPFSASDLFSLFTSSLEASRKAARAEFIGELQRTQAQLIELLEIDNLRSPAESSADTVAASLGAEGGMFFDTAALAGALRTPSSRLQPMEGERRARIEATIATLGQGLEDLERQPPYFLFESAACFQDALDFCDRQLDQFTVVLRALRLSRLEIESAYQPSIHDEALSRFDWQAADAEELLAIPAVIVMETAENLAQASLTAFARLLRSGRPIQVLVTSSGLYTEDLSGLIPDFGYIAIAHREAFVLQSSLARPDHLAAGFAEMTAVLRPAVALVLVPAGTEDDARAAAALACSSRAFPLYRYDPDRGSTWAERFQLLVEKECPATAADYAALTPVFRHHFRVLSASDWDDEQMEIGAYLKCYAQKPPLAIPFVWLTGIDGSRQRAAITRELVNFCRDRVRAWRIFEELAGVENAYVEAAVTRARQEAQQIDSVAGQKARLDGANEAIHRIVAMLLQPGAEAPEEPQPPPAVPAPVVSADATEPVAEIDISEEPYIDSFLCTSCNDCFKVNPRLFNYDGNKQAYIADARAGTFAELVKAAEGCPAKCIHPGMPRPDDKTATPQLLAKAAKLR